MKELSDEKLTWAEKAFCLATLAVFGAIAISTTKGDEKQMFVAVLVGIALYNIQKD